MVNRGETKARPRARLTASGRYVSITDIFTKRRPEHRQRGKGSRRTTDHGRRSGGAPSRYARRQIRSVQGSRVHHRHAGRHPHAAHAARARQAGGPEHGRFRLRLSRLPHRRLDQNLWRARKWLEASNIVFQPGLNEELAATAIWGSQQAEIAATANMTACSASGTARTGRRPPPATCSATPTWPAPRKACGGAGADGDDHTADPPPSRINPSSTSST